MELRNPVAEYSHDLPVLKVICLKSLAFQVFLNCDNYFVGGGNSLTHWHRTGDTKFAAKFNKSEQSLFSEPLDNRTVANPPRTDYNFFWAQFRKVNRIFSSLNQLKRFILKAKILLEHGPDVNVEFFLCVFLHFS